MEEGRGEKEGGVMDTYEVKFKPIVVEAENPEDAEQKAIQEVIYGNLVVDEIDFY